MKERRGCVIHLKEKETSRVDGTWLLPGLLLRWQRLSDTAGAFPLRRCDCLPLLPRWHQTKRPETESTTLRNPLFSLSVEWMLAQCKRFLQSNAACMLRKLPCFFPGPFFVCVCVCTRLVKSAHSSVRLFATYLVLVFEYSGSPAITNVMGPMNFIYYISIFVIANLRNENKWHGDWRDWHFMNVLSIFLLLLGLLQRGVTVILPTVSTIENERFVIVIIIVLKHTVGS